MACSPSNHYETLNIDRTICFEFNGKKFAYLCPIKIKLKTVKCIKGIWLLEQFNFVQNSLTKEKIYRLFKMQTSLHYISNEERIPMVQSMSGYSTNEVLTIPLAVFSFFSSLILFMWCSVSVEVYTALFRLVLVLKTCVVCIAR